MQRQLDKHERKMIAVEVAHYFLEAVDEALAGCGDQTVDVAVELEFPVPLRFQHEQPGEMYLPGSRVDFEDTMSFAAYVRDAHGEELA